LSLPAPAASTTALITGASSGIGTELARDLARRGYGLTITARRSDRLEDLAQELRDVHSVTVDVHAGDLGDDTQRAELVAKVSSGERELIGLCNNAGFGSFGRFNDLDQEVERQMVALNVVALHELTGALLGDMVRRGHGAILNVASTAAFQPLPGAATYAATKAFVLTFSEAVHAELAGTGVSCTSLCPGPVSTEFAERAGVSDLEAASRQLFDSAEDVARQAVEAMLAGRRSVIPGVVNRLGAFGGRFVPRTLLLPAIKRVGDRRFAR